jgi:UDP-N-acetylglucosamine 2-epimerase (non-hydrolysing)
MLQSADSRYIAIVVRTRLEIVKLAPLTRALGADGRLLHTCQHEDEELSGVFLAAAGIRQARTLAGIYGAPQHAQVGRIKRFLR